MAPPVRAPIPWRCRVSGCLAALRPTPPRNARRHENMADTPRSSPSPYTAPPAKVVRLLSPYRVPGGASYQRQELVGLPVEEAHRLVAEGYAEWPHDPSPSDPTPAVVEESIGVNVVPMAQKRRP